MNFLECRCLKDRKATGDGSCCMTNVGMKIPEGVQ